MLILDEVLKTDMGTMAEKMKKLNVLDQIIIASKIDALFERQMIDETNLGVLADTRDRPRKTG